MKALSLWQPWATLVAIGAKEYETRHWQYRSIIGKPLAIHAAKRWTREEARVLIMYKSHISSLKGVSLPLPLGAMLCVVRVVDILPTDTVRSTISVIERSVGNYEPNRFAWKMEIVEVFDVPIPAKGAQGLFEWSKP